MSTGTEKEDSLPLQSMTIEHLFKQGNLNVVGEIILNSLKLHMYILTTNTYFMVNDSELIQSLQLNVIIRFGVPNSLVFYIAYLYFMKVILMCLTNCLLQIIQKIVVQHHKDWHDDFDIEHEADRVTYRISLKTFSYFLVYGKG